MNKKRTGDGSLFFLFFFEKNENILNKKKDFEIFY